MRNLVPEVHYNLAVMSRRLRFWASVGQPLSNCPSSRILLVVFVERKSIFIPPQSLQLPRNSVSSPPSQLPLPI